MTLKIKTSEIELDYVDQSIILEESTKTHLVEIINYIYSHRVIHFDKQQLNVFPHGFFNYKPDLNKNK